MVKLESLAAPVHGAFAMGPFGSKIKSENFVADGVPVIRGGNLVGGRLVESGFVFLTRDKATELSKSKAVPGDIVITHRGTLGQVAMIPRNAAYGEYIVSQSQLKLSFDESKVIPEYLAYWFRSSQGQHALMTFASQNGVPALAQPLTNLRQLDIELPTLDEQMAIAGTLGPLDEKIASNTKIQLLLDQMNRADFERALIHESLTVLDFDQVAERLVVKAIAKEKISSEGKYSVWDQGSSGLLGYSELDPTLSASMERPVILFGDHTCTLRLVTKPCHVGPNLIAFTANAKSGMDPIWLYFALVGKQEFQEYRRHWMELAQKPVVRVPKHVEDEFVRSVRPRLELHSTLSLQNRTLETLRELLLSELTSGRVRVSDFVS